MADIHIVRDYPHPPAKVWRAVTDPELIPLWTATGQGGRPVGFAPVVGTRFQFVAKPVPGWRGIVDCEVLDVREPSLLRFSWTGEEGGTPTYVTYRIESHDGGTRFTFDHVGFTGLGGFVMARLLGSVRKKMLTTGLPAVLDDLDDTGTLRATSALRATPSDLTAAANRTAARWSSRTVILTIRLRTPHASSPRAPMRKNHHIPCVSKHTGQPGLLLLLGGSEEP